MGRGGAAAVGRDRVPAAGRAVQGRQRGAGQREGWWSIADRLKGTYGWLRAMRPGEFVILDTQCLDVFAVEPVTCRWMAAKRTVAQDLFIRWVLGLRVTPVSTGRKIDKHQSKPCR